MVVAGEVDATDAVMHNVRGFPSEKKLAKNVLALPDEVRGKTLIPANVGGDIAPCQEAGKVVKVSIIFGPFEPFGKRFMRKLWSMKNHIITVEHNAFAGGAHIRESISHTVMDGGMRLVLKDQYGTPLALAVEEIALSHKADTICSSTPLFDIDAAIHEGTPLALAVEEISLPHKAYTICSSTPLFDNDAAFHEEGDVKFYPMFKVHDIDSSSDHHDDFRSLLVWNGNHWQKFLHILPAMSLPVVPPDTAAAPGREHDVTPKKGDMLVVDPDDMEKVYAIFSKKNMNVLQLWDLTIAPGADVGCMLILGAILDDMVGAGAGTAHGTGAGAFFVRMFVAGLVVGPLTHVSW